MGMPDRSEDAARGGRDAADREEERGEELQQRLQDDRDHLGAPAGDRVEPADEHRDDPRDRDR
ncbi:MULTISPECIES: hypothetical protein [Streptomyces]|uniref:hypothetical protein n=1 Tax=Streptomyces TaxID=1883 RepID=UPI0022492BF2|nr:hypothetical protein [Streptomyces sp. JHD 1]MCX2968151.1 hypothetical protein [Streptomyces sp. JHD 1]